MTSKRWIGLASVGIVGLAVGAGAMAAVLVGPMHFRSNSPVAQPTSSGVAATSPGPTSSAVTVAAASPSPTPSGTPTTYFPGALQYAIGAAEEKTGLQYAASGCSAGQKCLSHAQETDGENALYVGLDASGYSGGSKCYVYVYRDPVLSWQTFQLLCGTQPGFSPVYGDTVPVRVSGGCANVRQGPGLNSALVGCLSNGTLVKIDATPTFADNKMWWGVASGQVAGSMSQEFLVG